MEKLSREFKNLLQHFTKQMHSNLRVWKNLTKCNKADCFSTPFGVVELSNQVWTPAKIGFKLDMPLSKNNGNLGISVRDFMYSEIYSHLEPP